MNFHQSNLAQWRQTVVIMAVVILLNACSSIQRLSANSEDAAVNLSSIPSGSIPSGSIPNGSASQPQIKLELQVRRHGFEGRVHIDVQDAPKGMSAQAVTLEENQDQASITLTGQDQATNAKMNAKATLRLRFANLEVSRSVSLTSAKLVLDLPGGTHSQMLRNINSNLDSGAFVTHQVYANFKGSTCQIMIRSLTAGLYICLNGSIQAGKTYSLITARDSSLGTASITYFQGPAASSSRQALWDSVSGSIKILSLSGKKIEFSINAAKFVPAKGFGKNLANGEFMLEATTTVTEVSNLP
jgi:hypothetical protein